MNARSSQLFAFKSSLVLAAIVLLLLAGALTAGYQYHSTHAEHRRQLAVEAKVLAASVTAAISFNDRATAQEYVAALMLDPRLDAAAVFNEAHQRVAGFQRAGSEPIRYSVADGDRLPNDDLLVEVPAYQGPTAIGSVYLRAAKTPLLLQLMRYSGVLLLTAMAVLMLIALGQGQRTLTLANVALRQRAHELADANERLTCEMTQRARTEDALRQSQKMEAIGQLSGGIAHDFNNLLMITMGSLTQLQKKLHQDDAHVERVAQLAHERLAVGPEQDAAQVLAVLARGLELVGLREARHLQLTRYLEVAAGSIDRAASLTQRVLSFARQQPLLPDLISMDALIRSIQPLLDHSVGANVKLDYQLNSQWTVLCDSNQMENAILNLVINARDAMSGGGEITIRTNDVRVDEDHPLASLRPGDYVHLRVEDTGMGMSEEVRRKAFDPFFTTKPVGKGTGLGLSTIMGYVAQSDGAVSIDSEIGHGTTINIALPRAASGRAMEGA